MKRGMGDGKGEENLKMEGKEKIKEIKREISRMREGS